MKTELDKNKTIEKAAAINLPAGSLWHDLRAEAGHGCGIEWLLLYEEEPLALKPSSRLLYVKVIIQTTKGREAAENGQSAILSGCKLRSFETAIFIRALTVAMSEWDAHA